jgi:HD superfamily phosphohydrolase
MEARFSMSQSLEHLDFTSRVSDPIWGSFPITEVEKRVLATPEVCRLQNIKQMGLAFLDYPGLTHTRLEHSLGVMFVADQIFTILRETARQVYRQAVLVKLFNRDHHQAVRLAALLHDLGHPPFSHAVELTFIRYPCLLEKAINGHQDRNPSLDNETLTLFREYSHEAFTRWIIANSQELESVLRARFKERPGLVDEIAKLAVGKARRSLAPFNTIISGDFDADRIDYLIRDNRHSGFAIGLSPDELHNAVHLLGDGSHAEIYIDKNALPFVNSLLSARERLIQRVHLAPAGRAATQKLTSFLFEDLSQLPGDRLAETILNLHSICNDYTFVGEISRSRRGVKARHADVAEMINMTSRGRVWEEAAHLGFMQMDPCLRLQAYVSAKGEYDSPDRFIEPSANLFVEPSARPAPKFSVRVDYECRPKQPSFDFIASSENRQGRAVLAQSLSNLDIFAYRMIDPADKRAEGKDSGQVDGAEDLLAGHIAKLAAIVRKERNLKEEGMLGAEFLLVLLFYVDRYIARTFEKSRSIYVFSAEAFINEFCQALIEASVKGKEDWSVPREFHQKGKVDANRIFSEIQRLNVFGLVETRQRPTFHDPASPISSGTRRTRTDIYGTREDFRISHWGKHYVETIIGNPERKARICSLIEARQKRVRPFLEQMALAYPLEPTNGSRVIVLRKFFAESATISREISSRGGCVMIFRWP